MIIIYIVFMSLALYHRNKSTYIYFKTLTSLTFVIAGVYYGYQNQIFMLIPTLIGFLIGDMKIFSPQTKWNLSDPTLKLNNSIKEILT